MTSVELRLAFRVLWQPGHGRGQEEGAHGRHAQHGKTPLHVAPWYGQGEHTAVTHG